MKSLSSTLFLFLIFILFMTSCNESTSSSKQLEGLFTHTVYFWLKEPQNLESRKTFEKSIKKFVNNSKHILSVQVGTPADTDRGVIDNSYTYSLIVTFASAAEQDNYQEEVAHKSFIKECEDLWEKVIVYDSVPL